MALCGVALVKGSLVSELYLDLICGSGCWGKRLFNEVEIIGRDFGKTRIIGSVPYMTAIA